jgi:2-oxoglutarate ferredoxin oxidoreductase subunit alpha
MPVRSTNIVIGGEAGQGLVTVGQLLCRFLTRSGYRFVVTQSYMSRIRGGHNTFEVRVSPDPVEAPTETVDVLVALNKETVALHRDALAPEGLIVGDEASCGEEPRCLKVPFAELAPKQFANVSALGVLVAVLGLDPQAAAATVEQAFGAKHPEMAGGNRSALEKSCAWAADKTAFLRKLPPPSAPAERLMLTGNEAVALGAISAGLRFVSFYPMTPATSIPLTVIGVADRMGIVVEQAEDEIAAINMAIGASFAGAPSMVATSGGGFSLMAEGVSLAGMTETPVVIVVGQRPAPATGLPTRTEQADLEFVLHAGHGEFPRAVFSPGTVEECFDCARKAFEVADRCQGPVFILTDQFIADSYRAVEPFAVDGLDAVMPGVDPASVAAPYQRHAFTESGVSPRLLPGRSRHLVVTDSDEHSEDGHITEDLGTRKLMVEKRMRKFACIARETLAPVYEGGASPGLLLVSWGSTRGSVREAAAALASRGLDVSTLHFRQVWPMVPAQFVDRLNTARRVVCIEGNATGQLARLIRRETGFVITERVLRYDGLPITPEYVLRGLKV